MDAAFHRRAQMLLDRRPLARIDHAMLVAALAAQRSASAAARALASAARPCGAGEEEPLVELLLGGDDWKKAATAQQGCFSRAEVRRRVNGA